MLESGLNAGGDLSGALNSAQIDPDAVGDDEIANAPGAIVIPVTELNPPVPGGTDPAPEFRTITAGSAAALAFDSTTPEAVLVSTRIPGDRVEGTNLTLTLLWSNDFVGTGNVTWTGNVVLNSVGEIAGSGAVALSPTSVPVAGEVAEKLHSTTLSTSAPLDAANGGLLTFTIRRNPTAGSDTEGADAQLHLIQVNYTARR